MEYAIIGAGMAGLACADALRDSGHSVALFDKGRGPGGRVSTRRLETPLGEVSIDHGAQYLTARDPGFRHLVGSWSDLGLVAPWPPAGADAWVGVPGMNAIIRQMASAHKVAWGHLITGIVRTADKWWLLGENAKTGPYDALILAIPAEQAAAILSLHDFDMARIALKVRSQPCWTSMFVFEQPLDGLPEVIRNSGCLGWAARNSAKPGRSGPEAWVVQASGSWSLEHLEKSQEQVSEHLYAALSDVLGRSIPEPVTAVSHRWRYALSLGTGDGALWSPKIGLGVCGDWLLGPRVECAWQSGKMLAARCIETAQIADAAAADDA
jgi:renalase